MFIGRCPRPVEICVGTAPLAVVRGTMTIDNKQLRHNMDEEEI